MLIVAEENDDTEKFLDAVDSGVSSSEDDAAESEQPKQAVQKQKRYDPRKRDPQFALAERTCLWELVCSQHTRLCRILRPHPRQIILCHHFQPSVAYHATELVQSLSSTTSADLEQYSQSHFLDRFAYRDPKKAGALRGSSAMQPAAPGQDSTGVVTLKKGVGVVDSEKMNDEQFWRKSASEISPDQVRRAGVALMSYS